MALRRGHGAAVADTLLGKVNPSGKLAQTFYRNISDVAAYHNYSYDMQNAPHDEGIMVGYRQFTSDNIKPLYAFGHGLSYTEFEYNDMSVSLGGDELTVSLQVSNVGKVAGKEVVQLYFAPPKITLMKRPPLQLCGFDKISLLPGQKKLISIKIPLNYLEYYNPLLKTWALDCGIHKIFAGSASDDLRIEAAIDIKNDIPATEFLG